MSFQVVWEESARREVAAEFVKAKDKVALIDATYQFDLALKADPLGNGHELSEGLHFIDRYPLRAIYSIDTAAQRVEIVRIRRIT